MLAEVVEGLVAGLQFPKNMRWGTQTLRFARPIRWIVALHGTNVVDVEIAGVRSGRLSRGHRFGGGSLELDAAADYPEALRPARRGGRPGRAAAPDPRGARPLRRDLERPRGVLDEVVHLGEWPTVLRGAFSERYLELPDRALVAAMQSHQRYFPLTAADGRRAPGFLSVVTPGAEARRS